MHSEFILRYRKHLRRCRLLTKVLPPTLSIPLCGWLSKRSTMPRPGKDGWDKARTRFPQLAEKTYADHLELLGVMEAASFYFQNIERLLKDVSTGHGIYDLSNLSSGALILTYHHHFNILLCTFLGHLINRPVNVLAMDPSLSPLSEPLAWYRDILYKGSEDHFAGGRYIFVRPDTENSLNRGLRDLLRCNAALVSVHDFGHPFANERAMERIILGCKVIAPVGAIAFAVARKIPVFSAWVEWRGAAKFAVECQLLDNNTEARALEDYFTNLESMIAKNPAIWEGWPSICNTK